MEVIKLIEKDLARAFTEVYDISRAWYPKRDVLGTAMCLDCRESDIDLARQNLGIEITNINGLEYWKWTSGDNPEEVWELIDNGIWV